MKTTSRSKGTEILLVLSVYIHHLIFPSFANAILVQHPEATDENFVGFAKALNEQPWVDYYLSNIENQTQIDDQITIAIADAQKEWIESKRTGASNFNRDTLWSSHIQLWNLTLERRTAASQRELIAEMFRRIYFDNPTELAGIWFIRACSLDRKQDPNKCRGTGTDSLFFRFGSTQLDPILQNWFKHWDAVLIDGVVYKKGRKSLNDLIFLGIDHRVVFLSNKLQTVSSTVPALELSAFNPPRLPWVHLPCINGKTFEFRGSALGKDPLMNAAHESGPLNIAGAGLCQMVVRGDSFGQSLSPSADAKNVDIDSDIRAFGLSRGEDGAYVPIEAPVFSSENRMSIWPKIGLGILALGAYAVWRNQQPGSTPPVHHQGF